MPPSCSKASQPDGYLWGILLKAKILDLWSSLFYVAFGTAVFIGIAMQITQVFAKTLGNVGSTVDVLAAGVLAVGAVELMVVRFLGPARASLGKLVWKSTENHAGKQRLQALGVVLLIAAASAILLVLTSSAANVPTNVTIVLLSAVLVVSAGVVPYVGICQRLAVPKRVAETSSILIAGAMAILGVAALWRSSVTPLPLAGITFAAGLGISLWNIAKSKHVPKEWRLVPRWELLRANARFDHAWLSVADLDVSHYRDLSDANKKSKRRALRLSSLPKPLAMFVTVLVRSWPKQWKIFAAASFPVIVFAHLATPVVGCYIGMAGSVVLAMRASGAWTEWNGADLARRLFGSTVPGASLVVLAALLIPPVLLAALTGAAASLRPPQVLGFAFIGLCTAIFTILGRADASMKRRIEGVMGATLTTPEVGVITVGPVRAMVAGWLVATLLVVFNLNNPSLQMLALTGVMAAFSIIRAVRSSK